MIHAGTVEADAPQVGDEVIVAIAADARSLHTRLHTAGELICAAMPLVADDPWPVAKAIHFPGHSAVEFARVVPRDTLEALTRALQTRIDEMIRTGHAVILETAPDPVAASVLCGFIPDYLASGEPVRVVRVWGSFGRPCVGTHVRDIAEIGELAIRRIKVSGRRTVVSYSVAERGA